MSSGITPQYVEELRRRREVFRLRSKAYAKALVASEARHRGIDVEIVDDTIIESLSVNELGEIVGLDEVLARLAAK